MLCASLVTAPAVYLACRLGAFTAATAVSIKVTWPIQYTYLNARKIDSFAWKWLDRICGNPEDGASGQCALVWRGADLVSYAVYTGLIGQQNAWRLAWKWNMRNKVQRMKYALAIPGEGPYRTFTLFGHTFGYGYKIVCGLNVPVGSKLT